MKIDSRFQMRCLFLRVRQRAVSPTDQGAQGPPPSFLGASCWRGGGGGAGSRWWVERKLTKMKIAGFRM